MVCASDGFQDGARAEAPDNGKQEPPLRQRVAIALDKEHRYFDFRQMQGAIVGWLVHRMKWETDKGETADFRKRRDGLGLRGHAAAERLTAGNQRFSRCKP